MVCGSIL
jgi:hypothetical protein